MQNSQQDIISISDIFITLIKHLKLWLFLIIAGTVISLILALNHTKQYNYSVSIEGPKYIEGSNVISLIPQAQFDRLLQVYFQKLQALNQQDQWIQALIFNNQKDKKNETMLSLKAPDNQMDQVTSAFDRFVDFVMAEPSYQQYISNWQNNMQFSISQLEAQNKTYEGYLAKFQTLYEELIKKEEYGSINGQAILNTLSQKIISYQDILSKNNLALLKNQLVLNSLDKNPSYFGGVIKSPKAIGLSSTLIMLLGILLSIFIASAIVFLLEFIYRMRIEIKAKLSNPIQPERTLDWNTVATKKIKEVSL